MTKKQVAVSCKIGTIPAVVIVWRNMKPEVGKTIKFRDAVNGKSEYPKGRCKNEPVRNFVCEA